MDIQTLCKILVLSKEKHISLPSKIQEPNIRKQTSKSCKTTLHSSGFFKQTKLMNYLSDTVR